MYKTINEHSVLLKESNTFITLPATESYGFAYLAWLAEGNTPEPADLPDPTVIEAQRIQALWQAAHDYEYAQISGSAIGLLAIGVMQAKPKCVAVQNWIKSIWDEFYVRKANGSADTDYSFAGACPHSVPELMAELGL